MDMFDEDLLEVVAELAARESALPGVLDTLLKQCDGAMYQLNEFYRVAAAHFKSRVDSLRQVMALNGFPNAEVREDLFIYKINAKSITKVRFERFGALFFLRVEMPPPFSTMSYIDCVADLHLKVQVRLHGPAGSEQWFSTQPAEDLSSAEFFEVQSAMKRSMDLALISYTRNIIQVIKASIS